MTSLGCAVVEMLIPAKVQLSACGLTGKQREGAIVKLFESNHKLLPRFVKSSENASLLYGVPHWFKLKSLWVKSLSLTIQMKDAKQYFSGMFFTLLYKVVQRQKGSGKCVYKKLLLKWFYTILRCEP